MAWSARSSGLTWARDAPEVVDTSAASTLVWLPNALTISRLVLSPGIPLLMVLDRPLLAALLFLFCGFTDAIDGTLARLLHASSSSIGARLDSFADAVYFAAGIAAACLHTDVFTDRLMQGGLLLVTVTRLANLLVTRRRFGCWSAMHTIANKITATVVIIGIGLALLLGDFPRGLSLLLVAIALLSAADELVMVLRHSTYDANAPGYSARVLQAVRRP